jgi:sigma-70-like protein
MSAVENLPGDQRAVLQLVLSRGRSYAEIARLLSINPDAVRERALAALDALGPQTKVDQPSRAQISDYLLGQLPGGEIDGVRDRLAESAGERAWARVVSSELGSLAPDGLPEIPVETSAARAAQQPPEDEPATPPLPTAGEPAVAATAASSESAAEPKSRLRRRRREPRPPREPKSPRKPAAAGESGSAPRSSRLGGLIVIGVVLALIIVGLIVLLGSGGSKKQQSTIASTPANTPAASATNPSAPAASSTTTTSTSTAAKVVSQINLTPPAAGSKAAGIAEVLREGSTNGIAIVAQNVPPNTTHPPNAYAVWLYNSPTDAKILGFVNPGVPKSGKLSTAGGLPTNASHYKQLIVTVESSSSPKAPGTVILQGTLTGV